VVEEFGPMEICISPCAWLPFAVLAAEADASFPEAAGRACGTMMFWLLAIVVIVALANRGRGGLAPWRGLRLGWAAPKWGLRKRGRLTQRQLDALDDLPLCHFARWCKFSFSGWVLEGDVLRFPLRIFEMAFEGKFRDAQDRRWTLNARQTVAVVDGLDLPWCFHRGPAKTEWDRLSPGWPALQGLLSRFDLPSTGKGPPAVLYLESKRQVKDVVGQSLLDELAELDDWVVEYGGGLLMIYRHEQIVTVQEQPHFLDTVRRVVAAFADAGAPDRGRAQRDLPDHPEGIHPDLRPGDAVRRRPWESGPEADDRRSR
jgi:hypothetical protein